MKESDRSLSLQQLNQNRKRNLSLKRQESISCGNRINVWWSCNAKNIRILEMDLKEVLYHVGK